MNLEDISHTSDIVPPKGLEERKGAEPSKKDTLNALFAPAMAGHKVEGAKKKPEKHLRGAGWHDN